MTVILSGASSGQPLMIGDLILQSKNYQKVLLVGFKACEESLW